MSTAAKIEQPRTLTAASCSVCGADRPLTAGLCEHCAPQPVIAPRWMLRDGDFVLFAIRWETLAIFRRLHPLAVVTDLLSLACPASECGGTCTGRCDAGAGCHWEIAEAERKGCTVSDLRAEGIR